MEPGAKSGKGIGKLQIPITPSSKPNRNSDGVIEGLYFDWFISSDRLLDPSLLLPLAACGARVGQPDRATDQEVSG